MEFFRAILLGGKSMGRPSHDLDDYLEWQQRLESKQESDLSVDVFCLQEGVSRSTYYRWVRQLAGGIPESLQEEQAEREKAETGEAVFLPITLKASPVEIELPNGGVVRLPLGVGQAVLVEVIRAAGALRPWKAPKS
jgi:transposase-like protein